MIFALALNILLGVSDTAYSVEKELDMFTHAVSMTTDGKGFIYVLDKDQNQIYKLDSNLNVVKVAGGKGWNQVQFDAPTFIDGSSGLDIIVSDPNNYRIQRLDLNLAFISQLKTDQPTFLEQYQFKTPISTTVVNASDLYVVDGDNKRVVVFPRGADPNNAFGGFNSPKGKVVDPAKIGKDGNNMIYVLDKGNSSIKVYDNFGSYQKDIRPDKILSFSIYGNILFIFDGKTVITYDINKGSFAGSMTQIIEEEGRDFTDFLVYNNNKYLLLEKNKVSLLINKN
ncbi:MAG: NHL repeat-containing protein [Ignavibacteriae bacterium]|nr:NHL repeat-containing protein [Ignavibacteriota bacterium]